MSTRHIPRLLVLFALLAAGCGAGSSSRGVPEGQGMFPADYVEPTTRPELDRAAIQKLVPARGAFTFPAPWSTRGARITNDSDCGGTDCVQSAGYAYWRNIN